MINPSIDEITKGKYNRYTLVIATAKCARQVTDEYIEENERIKLLEGSDTAGKNIAALYKRDRTEKVVKTAINRLNRGEYVITEMPEDVDRRLAEEAAEKERLAIEREAAEAAEKETDGSEANEATEEAEKTEDTEEA